MIYGNNRISSFGESTVEADVRYANPFGAMQMVIEAYQNDQAIFNAVIEQDFAEAAVITGALDESALEVMNEGFLGDMWNKILELIKKVKEKIIAIVKSFLIKFSAFFTKDNKALAKKYEKEFTRNDLSKMKVKNYQTINETKETNFFGVKPASDAFDKIFDTATNANDFTFTNGAVVYSGTDPNKEKEAADKAAEAVSKYMEDFTDKLFYVLYNDGKLEVSQNDTGTKTKAEYDKDVWDDIVGDKETLDGIKTSDKSDIISLLTNYNAVTKDIRKTERSVTDSLKAMENKAKSYASKAKSADSKLQSTTVAHVIASACSTIVTSYQTVAGAYFALQFRLAKFKVAQARRVFIMGASYRARKENAFENFDYVEALGEAAAEEFETDMMDMDVDVSEDLE